MFPDPTFIYNNKIILDVDSSTKGDVRLADCMFLAIAPTHRLKRTRLTLESKRLARVRYPLHFLCFFGNFVQHDKLTIGFPLIVLSVRIFHFSKTPCQSLDPVINHLGPEDLHSALHVAGHFQ